MEGKANRKRPEWWLAWLFWVAGSLLAIVQTSGGVFMCCLGTLLMLANTEKELMDRIGALETKVETLCTGSGREEPSGHNA